MGGSRALRPVANSETFGRHKALERKVKHLTNLLFMCSCRQEQASGEQLSSS